MFGGKTTRAVEGAVDFFCARIDGRDKAAQRILDDFSWLWAILGYWSPDQAENVRVDQSLCDLALAIARTAAETRFKVWALTTQPCGIFNLRICQIPAVEHLTWAEALAIEIRRQSYPRVLHVVTVDAKHDGDVCPWITIFRSADKQPLNETIEDVVRIYESCAR